MNPVVLIDTGGIIYRAFHTDTDGMDSIGYNIATSISRSIDHERIVFAMDKGPLKRKQICPLYKQSRSGKPRPTESQVKKLKNRLLEIGDVAWADGYEADDVIYSLSKQAIAESKPVVIVSSDKDLWALCEEGFVSIYDPVKKGYVTEEDVETKFGVEIHQCFDYLALCGDSSDSVKGCPGIGPVAARKLLSEYGTVEAIIDSVDLLNPQHSKKIKDGLEELMKSKKLVSLCDPEALVIEQKIDGDHHGWW